jgi:hypothetical protein
LNRIKQLKDRLGEPMSSLLTFYNHASIKAAYVSAQGKKTIYLNIAEMLAGELEDYRMYEYNGLKFFRAYNQLWNPSADGRFCRIIVQTREGKPRWVVHSNLYAAGGDA